MIKKFLCLFLICIFINFTAFQKAFSRELLLEGGTKIRLKLVDKISSGINQEGDEVNFITTEEIKIGDYVLIKEGARATGIISELTSKGRVGKAGKVTVTMDYVKAANSKKVPITGVINKKGEDKLFLSLGLTLIMPVIPVGLLFRGSEATVPAGYIVQSRVEKDVYILFDNIP